MTLNGKIALVTGGGRGIGRAISIALAQAGARVAVNYQTRKDAADAVVKEIATAGGHAVAFGADVSDETAVTSLFKAVTGELGDVGILVNNAGIAHQRTVDSVQLADFDEAIAREPPVGMARHQRRPPRNAPRQMGPHRSSCPRSPPTSAAPSARTTPPPKPACSASCTATRFAAGQGGHHLERDLTLRLIESDMVRVLVNVDSDRVPVGRYGTGEEVASIAVMLASNGCMTGQNIHPNGGMYFAILTQSAKTPHPRGVRIRPATAGHATSRECRTFTTSKLSPRRRAPPALRISASYTCPLRTLMRARALQDPEIVARI